MKKINFLKLISLLVVVVFAVSCKDKYPQSQSVNTLVALDKQNVTLHAGESTNVSAKVSFQKEDGENVVTTIEKKINWESSDTLVAKVDANGVIKAVKGGIATISAECQGVKEECVVLVKDIFVAGSFEKSETEKFAVIWQKCDTGAFIKYSVPNAKFAAMEVNEQGVYYAGTDESGAKIWKDGALYEGLEGENIVLTSMCIDKGDIYVTGYENVSTGKKEARLWKNGKKQELLEASADSTYAYDVAVANGNVYVVGKQFREFGSYLCYDAVIWANGQKETLPIPAGIETSQTRTICINNGSIYIGGSVDNESNERPYVWEFGENDSPVDFGNDKNKLYVKNIKFVNNELYAFYGTTLLMGNVKSNSNDMKSLMIQAQGSGYADAIESEGAVFIVGQGYPQYANGKTEEIESGYNKNAFAAILLKDNMQMDFLPRSMRAKAKGEEDVTEPEYPKSNAIAIGIK